MTASSDTETVAPSAADATPSTRQHSYAQTNIQLLNQLQDRGYAASDIARVARAYELAMVLLATSYRASGKHTLAHHVGTASILASLQAPVDVVIAGLLHAAYALGDFGDGRTGITAAKRRELAAVVGVEAEQYIHHFASLRWNQDAIRVASETLDDLDATARTVVLIRLANELENHLDLNMAYCRQFEWRKRFIENSGEALAGMARRLGCPTLAEHLARVFAETVSAQVPGELRRNHRLGFAVRPRSLRRRLRPTLWRVVDQLLTTVRLRRGHADVHHND